MPGAGKTAARFRGMARAEMPHLENVTKAGGNAWEVPGAEFV
jgi:hypothetical protein